MPTKTERILSYLPGTFRRAPRLSALQAVADAFGMELQAAENSLAAVMQAHWVDHADRNAEVIDDLACIAALYGLAPRADEDVEEFREHLKRYVRTFLDGTVTVQGILRVTAEALGLRVADDYEDLDTWWTRDDGELVTVQSRGDDAAKMILGVSAATDTGQAARPARVMGDVDLSGGSDLRETPRLRLKTEAAGPVEIDLTDGASDPAAVSLEEIETAIRDHIDVTVSRREGRYLMLASPTVGPTSRLEVGDVAGDAAGRLLGLAPRAYHGSAAQAAQVSGTVPLGQGVDLSQERYLRLVVDGVHVAEIDCAGPNPAQTTLDQVRDAINSALPEVTADHDGQFLTLASRTEGIASSIAFQKPAAQDATTRLFGPVLPFYVGRDAQGARVTGQRNLSGGVDLSERSNLRLKVDGVSASINCAGDVPAHTRPDEIVARINAAFEPDVVARHDSQFITLTSPTYGPAGEIILETPDSGDATQDIFGIPPRAFAGAAATNARLVGKADLSGGADLRAQYWLKVAVDSGPPVEINLRAEAAEWGAVTLAELAAAINASLGVDLASHDGRHLILVSPTEGGASRLAVEPMEFSLRRRFVTRATIIDEASQAIFGFTAATAQGAAETRARVVGKADLSRGVDLRERRYLRLAIDGGRALDIDCAGARPRATLIGEVVKAINEALGVKVASHDDRHLVLTSPTWGAGSRVAAEPRAADALEVLLGVEVGTYRGQAETGVDFVGLVDLSEGVDLEADAAIKLNIDDGETVKEITLGDPEPGHKALTQIVLVINAQLGVDVASQDDGYITLSLPPQAGGGARRQLGFEVPDGPDATQDVFGISPPRTYRGAEATPARVTGKQDLSGGVNLKTTRFLRLALDGGAPADVDCAEGAADPAATSLDEIVVAVNSALETDAGGIASHDGAHLILTSPGTGPAGAITLEPYTAGDAAEILLGAAQKTVEGTAPTPAVITGKATLLAPVDLGGRRLVRLAVDGGRPVDIDVAGANPEATTLDEIVAAINAVFRGLAAATEEGCLQLTWPGAGVTSHLALLPLRYLELIEYPPQSVPEPKTPRWGVKHGDSWSVENKGAADVFVEATIAAPQGAAGPSLVNVTLGWRLHLLSGLGVGKQARLWRDPRRGLQAEICGADGEAECRVPGSQILAGPLGAQVWVPFEREWLLTGDDEEPPTLQLNNPLAPSLVRLRGWWSGTQAREVRVGVTESDLSVIIPEPAVADGSQTRLVGRVHVDEAGGHLVDAEANPIAQLRAGPEISLEDLKACQDMVVTVSGPLHAGDPPLLVLHDIAGLFDVTLHFKSEAGAPVKKEYSGVTIGVGAERRDSLVRHINAESQVLQLVKAEELDKATVLTLPRGRSEWIYADCDGSRFDYARFRSQVDKYCFAAGGCHQGQVLSGQKLFATCRCKDRAIFDVSRFTSYASPEPVAAVFAPSGPLPDPAVEVAFRWEGHQPGAFVVNLPADLATRFGGRFNAARFGQGENKPEVYDKAVNEPVDDPSYLVARINASSTLLEASAVANLPPDWEAVSMPFRKPQFLSLGGDDPYARLYMAEDGLAGFIELKARQPGDWATEVALSARPAGPAMYDIIIAYYGARFENARQVALGKGPSPPAPRCQKGKGEPGGPPPPGADLPTLVKDLLRPGPIGVLQAKAAGVRAEVTRDRAGSGTCPGPRKLEGGDSAS